MTNANLFLNSLSLVNYDTMYVAVFLVLPYLMVGCGLVLAALVSVGEWLFQLDENDYWADLASDGPFEIPDYMLAWPTLQEKEEEALVAWDRLQAKEVGQVLQATFEEWVGSFEDDEDELDELWERLYGNEPQLVAVNLSLNNYMRRN